MEVSLEWITEALDRLNDTFNRMDERQQQWHEKFTPKVYRDGNSWCALYGDDLQKGVCGFGPTPAAAVEDYNRNWNK